MKKILLTCFVLGLSSIGAMAELNVSVDKDSVLPTIEPIQMNSCQQKEVKDIKNSTKINNYDNAPIFKTGDKKINVLLKQPDAYLGTQQ